MSVTGLLLPEWILWADVETTGLDPHQHKMLELSYVLTEFRYPYEDSSRSQVPRATYLVEGGMQWLETRADAFVREMHVKSGLEAALLDETQRKTSLGRIEQDLLAISADWPSDKDRRVMLGGNTAHFDLGFLREKMPEFSKRLSHRVFDASGFYRQCLSVGMPELPKPVEAHRAKEDVERSIDLARVCAAWILGRRG